MPFSLLGGTRMSPGQEYCRRYTVFNSYVDERVGLRPPPHDKYKERSEPLHSQLRTGSSDGRTDPRREEKGKKKEKEKKEQSKHASIIAERQQQSTLHVKHAEHNPVSSICLFWKQRLTIMPENCSQLYFVHASPNEPLVMK